MAFENIRCFKCQQYGHLAINCDDVNYAAELGDGKPPYCGYCDRDTRLVYFLHDGNVTARRCPTCHPSNHLLAAQFKRCRECRAVIYEWDVRSECGSHPAIGQRSRELEESWRNATERKAG